VSPAILVSDASGNCRLVAAERLVQDPRGNGVFSGGPSPKPAGCRRPSYTRVALRSDSSAAYQ